jgi:DNA-binding response OmpR family regulator
MAEPKGEMAVPARILVVEDDPRTAEVIALYLRHAGHQVFVEGDGQAALRRARETGFDLLVLDRMLPGVDGLSICRQLTRECGVPVLFVTARTLEEDRIEGFESGADDYLTKPFGIRELVARARALLRRPRRSHLSAAAEGQQAVTVAALTVDPARRHARFDGNEIELTAHEFDLLYLLASNPGIVFSREALVGRVWGDDTYVTSRSVDTLIKRIRKKIEPDPDEPRFILTVWGTGYKFADV